MNFGVTAVAPPNAASSSTARYSSTARLETSGVKPWAPSTSFWRLASALIRLPSTAKPSADEALFEAAVQHRLEHMAQKVAVAETAMPVLRDAVIGLRPWQPSLGRQKG